MSSLSGGGIYFIATGVIHWTPGAGVSAAFFLSILGMPEILTDKKFGREILRKIVEKLLK